MHVARSGIKWTVTYAADLRLRSLAGAEGLFPHGCTNERSRAALARIGGQFEGILRAHRMAADLVPRDSARFSIVAAEWPSVKERLHSFMT